jgi:hypothetical protein
MLLVARSLRDCNAALTAVFRLVHSYHLTATLCIATIMLAATSDMLSGAMRSQRAQSCAHIVSMLQWVVINVLLACVV